MTNRRVIIQSGVIGIDFTSIDFSQIINSEVSVGLINQMLKDESGSVNLTLNILESANKSTVNKKAAY